MRTTTRVHIMRALVTLIVAALVALLSWPWLCPCCCPGCLVVFALVLSLHTAMVSSLGWLPRIVLVLVPVVVFSVVIVARLVHIAG